MDDPRLPNPQEILSPTASPGPRSRVLLVEDNPGDARLTREAFRSLADPPELLVARDGGEALRVLDGLRHDGGLPNLILLDLNMPRVDGREVLARLKADPALRRVPVAVLTTSDADGDVADAYDLHANCFLTKPVDLPAFLDLVELVNRFWLGVVRQPPTVPADGAAPPAAGATVQGSEAAAGREPERRTFK